MMRNFSFIVHQRDGQFVLVSAKHGVVVRASELAPGIAELEARSDEIDRLLEKTGVDEASLNKGTDQKAHSGQIRAFAIKTAVVGAGVAIILIMATLPIARAISGAIGPRSMFGFAVSHPAQFVVELGNKVDQLPPERIEELKLAVQKITKKLQPLITQFKSGEIGEKNK